MRIMCVHAYCPNWYVYRPFFSVNTKLRRQKNGGPRQQQLSIGAVQLQSYPPRKRTGSYNLSPPPETHNLSSPISQQPVLASKQGRRRTSQSRRSRGRRRGWCAV